MENNCALTSPVLPKEDLHLHNLVSQLAIALKPEPDLQQQQAAKPCSKHSWDLEEWCSSKGTRTGSHTQVKASS